MILSRCCYKSSKSSVINVWQHSFRYSKSLKAFKELFIAIKISSKFFEINNSLKSFIPRMGKKVAKNI